MRMRDLAVHLLLKMLDRLLSGCLRQKTRCKRKKVEDQEGIPENERYQVVNAVWGPIVDESKAGRRNF